MTSNPQGGNRSRLVVLSILGLLLASQLAFAWHQHQHDATYLNHCKICSLHQTDDSAIAPKQAQHQSLVFDKTIPLHGDSSVLLNHTSKPPARAPPISNY